MPARQLVRRILPWTVSTALLVYVFGWLTDWSALLEATRRAHVPAFVAVTFADKMIFFLLWSVLQVTALRRLVGPVRLRSVLALRGGSELLRSVSNPLADAAFLIGLVHTTGGRPGRVILAASVPSIVHAMVLILQLSLGLALLPGGAEANRDVAVAAGVGWLLVVGVALGVRFTRRSSARRLAKLRMWLEEMDFRAFAPMLAWFVVLAFLDVTVQWLATLAFGARIPYLDLVARIPILYAAFLIPAFGNFGTRELAWAGLFAGAHDRDVLIAYAFATNTLFLVFHVVLGTVFLPRAIALLREVRAERRADGGLPAAPLVRDPGDP